MTTIKQHLLDRHLNISLHRPFIDEEERVATFLLYTITGKIAGYQIYRPDSDKKKKNHPREGRYYTYKTPGILSVWGTETLHLTPEILFVTEGVFDAARLTSLGYSAIASLSNAPPPEFQNWLDFLNRKIVVICDNDENGSGRKLAKFGHEAIFTEDKDLGDSSEEYVKWILNRFV